MSTGLIILVVFVGLVTLVGFTTETIAHKPSKSTNSLEDLRLAYAPNIVQVWNDQAQYKENERKRKYEDYRIKQWLEGNPTPLNEEPTVSYTPVGFDY